MDMPAPGPAIDISPRKPKRYVGGRRIPEEPFYIFLIQNKLKLITFPNDTAAALKESKLPQSSFNRLCSFISGVCGGESACLVSSPFTVQISPTVYVCLCRVPSSLPPLPDMSSG